MITPNFKLAQTDDQLTVNIRAPYTNVKNAEVLCDERTFLFASKPYFLRLFLPCDVVEDETLITTKYDADAGVFTVTVPKRNKGEFFPNLEMLSELLGPQNRREVSARKLVEEVAHNLAEQLTEEDELFATQTESDIDRPDDSPCDEICRQFGYGFGWRRHGVFARFADECADLIDLVDGETTPIAERSALCRVHDLERFDADHYLADLFEPDEYIFPECMDFTLNVHAHLTLDDTDRDTLKNIPRRKLPNVSEEEGRSLALSLIDLLAGYAFNLRFTCGELNVESAWTIAKLAPSLAFLVRWRSADEALVAFARRALIYPLIRHWDFVMKVIDNLQTILREGRTAILKCLLDIYHIFNRSSGCELRYLFNQLFIEEFILWVQSVDDAVLDNLRDALRTAAARLDKAAVELDLERLEFEARLYVTRMEELAALSPSSECLSDGQHRKNESKKMELLDSDDETETMPISAAAIRTRIGNAESIEMRLKENDERLAALCANLTI